MEFTTDFNRAPLLLIWEVTRACALACRHCRAAAIDERHPCELTRKEGKRLLDDTAKMGTPLTVFSGGDPLQRDDLEDLIAHAAHLGLRTGTIPAATDRLTQTRVQQLKDAGLNQMALSLDGFCARAHDDFRRVKGSFTKTMSAVAWARAAELPLQINTVFGAWNARSFGSIAHLVEHVLRPVMWEVFFLVPTGRGSELTGCTPEDFEHLFAEIFKLSKRVRFMIKVTEGPHYRRYVLERNGAGASRSPQATSAAPVTAASVPPAMRRHVGAGVNAGKGFCFVSHTGDVCPSGFLPLVAGNVRETSVANIYRSSLLFNELRNTQLLKGRCGRCAFREICGGSRSRAFALTGDYLAADPSCDYDPGKGTRPVTVSPAMRARGSTPRQVLPASRSGRPPRP